MSEFINHETFSELFGRNLETQINSAVKKERLTTLLYLLRDYPLYRLNICLVRLPRGQFGSDYTLMYEVGAGYFYHPGEQFKKPAALGLWERRPFDSVEVIEVVPVHLGLTIEQAKRACENLDTAYQKGEGDVRLPKDFWLFRAGRFPADLKAAMFVVKANTWTEALKKLGEDCSSGGYRFSSHLEIYFPPSSWVNLFYLLELLRLVLVE